MRKVPSEGDASMVFQFGSVVFFTLMVAQAFAAVISWAYPWHRVGHEDVDADGQNVQRSAPLLRMVWRRA